MDTFFMIVCKIKDTIAEILNINPFIDIQDTHCIKTGYTYDEIDSEVNKVFTSNKNQRLIKINYDEISSKKIDELYRSILKLIKSENHKICIKFFKIKDLLYISVMEIN